MDNSISNFSAHNTLQKNILITIREINSHIKVTIEDSGTGIKNIDTAFTIGNQESRETPLNEHGFGLKHALATADVTNSSWAVYTRTKEMMTNGKYVCVKAPYVLDEFKGEYINESDKRWKGEYNTTGTIVEFTCTKEFLILSEQDLVVILDFRVK